jgi:hypothetical protein
MYLRRSSSVDLLRVKTCPHRYLADLKYSLSTDVHRHGQSMGSLSDRHVKFIHAPHPDLSVSKGRGSQAQVAILRDSLWER